MFNPTHLLVSRSRPTPVQLAPSPKGYFLVTEQDWASCKQPAFEIRSKLGFFCQGVSVVGYKLQPIAIAQDVVKAKAATTTA